MYEHVSVLDETPFKFVIKVVYKRTMASSKRAKSEVFVCKNSQVKRPRVFILQHFVLCNRHYLSFLLNLMILFFWCTFCPDIAVQVLPGIIKQVASYFDVLDSIE